MVELTMPDLAAAMRAAVRGLVDRLDTEQRRQLVFPFDGDMHKRWTYLPGQRPGLRLGEVSGEQLEPALDLLQLVHSVRGWSDTQLVIRIEAVRRELSLQQAGRAGIDEMRHYQVHVRKRQMTITVAADPLEAAQPIPRYAQGIRLVRSRAIPMP
jgi:Protein of unknown function (DUF3500)